MDESGNTNKTAPPVRIDHDQTDSFTGNPSEGYRSGTPAVELNAAVRDGEASVEGLGGTALVYSEQEFGRIDGKVANGLVRHSERYSIVGVLDSSKAGLDAGEYLDGISNGIPIFRTLGEAILGLGFVPEYFIYGIAPLAPFLDRGQREIVLKAMQAGMSIVNGLPEFFSEDEEFQRKATEFGVGIFDVRKPPARRDLHHFTGLIHGVKTPVLVVCGTDCAVGKRTTSVRLVEALREEGLNAVFIATGQTGLLQGAKYGVAVDVLSSGFATGEVEHAILRADENEKPDIIIVEGQGALSHPAFTSSSAILRGSVPDAVIIQHPPKRKNHCDYSEIPMPNLADEIKLIELFSNSRVIAITINHEDLNDEELEAVVMDYEYRFQLPSLDVLKHGCGKLVKVLVNEFPELLASDRRRFGNGPSRAAQESGSASIPPSSMERGSPPGGPGSLPESPEK